MIKLMYNMDKWLSTYTYLYVDGWRRIISDVIVVENFSIFHIYWQDLQTNDNNSNEYSIDMPAQTFASNVVVHLGSLKYNIYNICVFKC